jgi:hypothetical protein
MAEPLPDRLWKELAHRRQIWLKRLANVPDGFAPASCCRAPTLPLFSRDIVQSGLICQHCSETLVPFEELPQDLQGPIRQWVDDYAAVHAVAHWDDQQRKNVADYETLLTYAARELLPRLLEHYPAILWEDQDECLEVLPEDIVLS